MASTLMAYLKTVVKLLVPAGYVRGGSTRQLGKHEQVRMRPPSMRAYAQRGAPGPEWLRVCVHPGCVRTPSEACRTRAAASTQHACVRPARRTGLERLRPPSMRAYTPSEAHRTRAARVHPAKRTAALTTCIPRTPLWLPQIFTGSFTFNEIYENPRTRSLGNKRAIVVMTSPSNVKDAADAWNYGVIERDHGGSAVAWAQAVVRRYQG